MGALLYCTVTSRRLFCQCRAAKSGKCYRENHSIIRSIHNDDDDHTKANDDNRCNFDPIKSVQVFDIRTIFTIHTYTANNEISNGNGTVRELLYNIDYEATINRTIVAIYNQIDSNSNDYGRSTETKLCNSIPGIRCSNKTKFYRTNEKC